MKITEQKQNNPNKLVVKLTDESNPFINIKLNFEYVNGYVRFEEPNSTQYSYVKHLIQSQNIIFQLKNNLINRVEGLASVK